MTGGVTLFTPETEDMTIEEIAEKLTAKTLERLKNPEDVRDLTFKSADYRNIRIEDIELVEGANPPYYYSIWRARPKAEIAYTGSYGLLGESYGTRYFNSEDMDTDGGMGLVEIYDKGGYYSMLTVIKKATTTRKAFSTKEYQYTPEDADISIQEAATHLIELVLEELKLPDSTRSFQITDYQAKASQIQWYEDKQCWRAMPDISIAYIGRYGELGKSDGTQLFDHLGTDGGPGFIKITKGGGTYTMTHLGDMEP